MLGEHAATRAEIKDLRSDIASALDASQDALARTQALLALQPSVRVDQPDLCAVMERANRAVLDQPIVPMDAERYGTEVRFPAISAIYINPRYRIAQAGADTKPSDDSWWEEQSSANDIDLTLAGHVMAPDATQCPLLLLGHPGAGKSLLTKVLAARLAGAGYTVVRVPLRQVGANAPISEQIQQALDLATHERVKWWQLAEQSRGAVQVVLLDGLDELLQASSSDRSGYLQEVMEFQRVEAVQEQPIVVVVTSRSVVADRVEIPAGTTIVKLDFFDDPDIHEWLRRWARANADLISVGLVRELTFEAALRQAELAKQPLLLLMLALYSADPGFPALDADLSTFGEYLVASRVMNELADVAHTALGGRRGPREPEDDLLFALLSHQPLAVRRSTLKFAQEIFVGLPHSERQDMLDVLDMLLASYRCRYGSDRYAGYRPVPQDRIRELAAYSANLVMLRVTLVPDSKVPLSKMLGKHEDLDRQWHSMVTLWRSGLDADGQIAMMTSLRLSDGAVQADFVGDIFPRSPVDIRDALYALLAGDSMLARRIRFGMAICDGGPGLLDGAPRRSARRDAAPDSGRRIASLD